MRTRSLILALTSFIVSAPAWAQGPDPLHELGIGPAAVMARVGSTAITGRDVVAEINRQIPLTFYHARLPEEQMGRMRREALEALIERELVYTDARARGLSATEGEILAEFDRTLTKAGPNYTNLDAESKAALLERFRPNVRRRILLDKNEKRFELSIPEILDGDLRAYYEETKSEQLTVEEAHLAHILLKVDPSIDSRGAAVIRQKLEDIRALEADGVPFGDLAREHSEDIYAAAGGDMGFVAKGSFQFREVDETAFSLKDGETSEVLSSLYGFHLVRRLATRPQRQLTFEEAREKLSAELAITRRDATRTAWLKELDKRVGVTILIDPVGTTSDGSGSDPNKF